MSNFMVVFEPGNYFYHNEGYKDLIRAVAEEKVVALKAVGLWIAYMN